MLFTATSLLGEARASVLSTQLRVGKGLVQPSPLNSGSVPGTFFHLVRCFCGSQLSSVNMHLETQWQASSAHSLPQQALGYIYRAIKPSSREAGTAEESKAQKAESLLSERKDLLLPGLRQVCPACRGKPCAQS